MRLRADERSRMFAVNTRYIDATYYNWKSMYDGMAASGIKKLNELEGENQRLKRMYADLSLQHEALKDIVEKKL